MEPHNSIISEEIVLSKIYYLREQKIMLDKDLAILYGVKAIRLREQVKRNMDRFPKNFMFQLTEDEVNLLVSQNAIPSKKNLGGYLPYAFTEHGVLMLANFLKSKKAIAISILIIEIFIKLREFSISNKEILLKLNQLERKALSHDSEIKKILEQLREFIGFKENRRKIGFRLGTNK